MTHILTHYGGRADADSGAESVKEVLILERKWLEMQGYQRIEELAALCNQQVGGSSPSTSSN